MEYGYLLAGVLLGFLLSNLAKTQVAVSVPLFDALADQAHELKPGRTVYASINFGMANDDDDDDGGSPTPTDNPNWLTRSNN